MTNFTFEQSRIVADIYRRYLNVRYIRLVAVPAKGKTIASCRIRPHVRQIRLMPAYFKQKRNDQIETLIHELCHARRGCYNHAKHWKAAIEPWTSRYRNRYHNIYISNP